MPEITILYKFYGILSIKLTIICSLIYKKPDYLSTSIISGYFADYGKIKIINFYKMDLRKSNIN
jgi:hypothetical protein